MDDWVVLCKNRRQLKKIIRHTYAVLDTLRLTIHPDKTYIGKIEKGFDFLGYHFQPDALCLAKVTLNKAIAKLLQLFEQGASVIRLCGYWRRFLQWAHAGCELRGSLRRGLFSAAVLPIFGRTVTMKTG